MDRSSSQLKAECALRGVILEEGKKYSCQDMVRLLGFKTLEQHPELDSWGMRARLSMESPMLCFSFKHLKDEEKAEVIESSNWGAEEKYDGCRMVVTYHPDDAFRFFSRNVSVDTYLPVEYTEKILLGVRRAQDFKGVFKKSFVLDSEVVVDSAQIDTAQYRKGRGTVTGTELNAVTAILAIATLESHKIQATQAPLHLVLFDVIQIDGSPVWKSPFRGRRQVLESIAPRLAAEGPFRLSNLVFENKMEFFQGLLKAGKEGCVLKNLDMPYIPTTSRRRDVQVKMKRSMARICGDIDAYVCGFVESDPKKGWAGLIGALKMAVRLQKEDGTEVEHWICTVGAIPLELRRAMTEVVNGKPCLKKEYLGKVLVVDGQDCSPKAMRFMHATPDWNRGFRTDKNWAECTMDETVLKSQIM